MSKNSVYFCVLATLCLSTVLSCADTTGWTDKELDIINQENDIVRVLQVNEKADSVVLRRVSTDIPKSLIGDLCWKKLCGHLLATVQDESKPGVGIACPQIGISRRIVAVQRFDKEGEPFEVYPNIRIIATRGEREPGGEGCLSVPDSYCEVLRWREIDVAYTSPITLTDTSETINGFTAVIFQHECDHLDGILLQRFTKE